MRKRLFCYAFAALCAAAVLPSCSDDDNSAPDYTQVIEDQIAGEYKGTLDIKVNGDLLSGDGVAKNITIEKASMSAITLSIKDFQFGINLGDIELPNCTLVADGENYTFTQVQKLDREGLKCTINAEGTLEKGGKLTLKLNMDDVMLGETPQKVNVVYTGTRLKGDENKEAKILSFTFDAANEKNACVIEQPVIGEDNTITFRVDEAQVEANPDLLKSLEPTIETSQGATYTTSLDKKDGFSKDVTYTVLSEDGKTTATYTVKKPYQSTLSKYSFEEWETVVPSSKIDPYMTPKPVDIWATSNGGAQMANGTEAETKLGYPVVIEEQGYNSTKSAKLITLSAEGTLAAMAGPITAGSLFTGEFVFNILQWQKPLKMTHFGVEYGKKPVKIKGVYKYKSGTPYIDENGDSHTDIADKASIMAVLYEATEETPWLDGYTINDSRYHVMTAVVNKDGIGETTGEDWVSFDVEFKLAEGQTYDPNKNYKLAIVCSSSKDGDKFMGAVGSTLWVDELEVIGE